MALPSFLHDKDYLYDLDNEKIKVQYIKIVLLTFDEEVIIPPEIFATNSFVAFPSESVPACSMTRRQVLPFARTAMNVLLARLVALPHSKS